MNNSKCILFNLLSTSLPLALANGFFKLFIGFSHNQLLTFSRKSFGV